jgi:hypothetical protein
LLPGAILKEEMFMLFTPERHSLMNSHRQSRWIILDLDKKAMVYAVIATEVKQSGMHN